MKSKQKGFVESRWFISACIVSGLLWWMVIAGVEVAKGVAS